MRRESEVMKKNLLTLVIDNKTYSLSEYESSRHREVQHGGRIIESAFYGVFAERLRLIANAKSVELKVAGNLCNETTKFSDTNVRLFKEFYETQVLSAIVNRGVKVVLFFHLAFLTAFHFIITLTYDTSL